MTGYGSRFVAAGYKELKPFIKVNGKTMIEWIVKGMYSTEEDFLFVCRKEHLESILYMEETLKSLSPKSKIYVVDPWEKKGPVYDVLRAGEAIGDEEECIINYCDFYMDWDFEKFKKEVKERDCAGSIPCYSGFHPHLLIEKNVYASCKVDANENLIEIKEKYSFEEDKMKAKHSPGVYYFKSGAILKKYCAKLVESGPDINGEYYASLPYNYMVEDGLNVWVPVNVEKFCQWGTPEDLEDYLFWTNYIRGYRK